MSEIKYDCLHTAMDRFEEAAQLHNTARALIFREEDLCHGDPVKKMLLVKYNDMIRRLRDEMVELGMHEWKMYCESIPESMRDSNGMSMLRKDEAEHAAASCST